jgi:uncharacterized repeat protein (TIGR03803 family)
MRHLICISSVTDMNISAAGPVAVPSRVNIRRRFPLKKPINARFLAFLSLLLSVFAGTNAQGQIFTTLHSLTAAEGSELEGRLIEGVDGNFYGTARMGGSNGVGSIFKITPGGAFSVLYSFGSVAGDGMFPYAGLAKGSDGNFYGTTGSMDFPPRTPGTVFKITPSGMLTTLYTLGTNPSDGIFPYSPLLRGTDGSFYGTTAYGGSGGVGTVFKVTSDGTAAGTTFTTIYSFSGQDDGASPISREALVQGSDGNFYGTTSTSGPSGSAGTVFKITSAGTLTTLHGFNDSEGGANPDSGLVKDSAGVFYGACSGAHVTAEYGTAFKVITDGSPAGTTETTLYIFQDFQTGSPQGSLVIDSDGNLYGMSGDGTGRDNGNLYRLAPDGTFTTLYIFTTGFDPVEAEPYAGIVKGSDGNFYGTTASTVFKFGAAPTPTPTPTPTPPPPGLSPTVFTVNESASLAPNLADTVLRFAAQQTGAAARLSVRVQASTTPAIEGSWSDLPNGATGQMTYDASSNQFVLHTTGYPLQNGISFRALSTASAYTDSISNVVGPFDLASGTTHLGPIALTGTANGTIADFYFRVTQSTLPAGVSLRVQSTATPANETSWADLSNGNAGQMQQSNDPNEFFLFVSSLPAADSIYFRAVAHLAGAVDSLSGAIGPVKITPVTPPAVTIIPPAGLPGSGDGHDFDHPIQVSAGIEFNFAASAASNRQLRTLELQVDGEPIPGGHFDNPPTDTFETAPFTPDTIGVHTLEAFAIDDLGCTSRAGTGVLYIRVFPAGLVGANAASGSGATPAASTGGRVFTVVNSGGDWHDPATWIDSQGNNGVPGQSDVAIIGASTVHCMFDVVAGSVSLSGGTIVGPGTLDINEIITISAGTFENSVLDISSSAVCLLVNSVDIQFGGRVENFGTWKVHGTGGVKGLDHFENKGTIEWQTPLTIPPNAGLDPAAASRTLSAMVVNISGNIIGVNPVFLISQDGGGLIAQGGGNLITQDGGTLIAQGGGNLIAQGGGNLITQDGGTLIAQGGGNLIAQGGGNVISTGTGPNIVGRGNPRAASTPSGFTQSGGETDLSSVSIVGPVTLNGGVLSGSGVIQGDLTNNGGFIAPGHSAGLLAVTGNFTQASNGTLIMEDGGPYPTQFDQLQVRGVANLGGKLDIKTINGYTPDPADTFSPLGFGSVSGTFASVSSNAQVTVNASGLLTSVDPTKPQPTTGQPLNIATRLQIQSGDNVLIGGFIITGPAGSTKKVLIRGIGPSLANFGVAGTIPDPFLELHKPDGSVVTNDNWQQAPNVAEIPSGFAPSNDLESIIYTSLSPGNYTAILKGAHGEAGVGLVEAYDFDTASTAKLANIATRGFVNTDDNVMIGGFIIGGTEPANVLVRAIGPSLTQFGVQGALQATTLELHDSNGSVISNEGWRSTQESEIQATTIPPTNDNEAAILATLVPGNYTAIVRGKNNTTGIAVVEAYNLQ